MRLEQMRRNVLMLSLEEATAVVESISKQRAQRLQEYTSAKERESPIRTTLSPEEKAILKALGLTMKDVKALKEGGLNG
jgi:hypothetical protein